MAISLEKPKTRSEAEVEVRGAYRDGADEASIRRSVADEVIRLRRGGLLVQDDACESVSMETEVWRPVLELPNTHEVSNYGVIRRLERLSEGDEPKLLRCCVLSTSCSRNGIKDFSVRLPGAAAFRLTVKKVVMEAFTDYPYGVGRVIIKHRDGDVENCRLDNLEYVL